MNSDNEVSKSTYICLINEIRQLPDFDNPPFEFAIRVPLKEVPNEIEAVKKIWIVSPYRNSYRTLGVIIVNGIEVLEDAFVFHGNASHSEYFCKNVADGIECSELTNLLVGDQDQTKQIQFLHIYNDLDSLLIRLKFENIRTSFSPIPQEVINTVLEGLPTEVPNSASLEERINLKLRRNFVSSMLHISGSSADVLSPFNYVSKLLSTRFLQSGVISLFECGVPIPSVDTLLTPLNPAHITFRKWIVEPDFDKSSNDTNVRIEKLNRAEKRHQEILKDCVDYLLSQNIQVEHSNSFDLSFLRYGYRYICEIKSSTTDNFVSQFDKGLIQINWYAWALRNQPIEIVKCLVIELPSNSALNTGYFEEFALQFGVRTLFWNPEAPWPMRIEGFLDTHRSFD
jgi:hypothetical protein